MHIRIFVNTSTQTPVIVCAHTATHTYQWWCRAAWRHRTLSAPVQEKGRGERWGRSEQSVRYYFRHTIFCRTTTHPANYCIEINTWNVAEAICIQQQLETLKYIHHPASNSHGRKKRNLERGSNVGLRLRSFFAVQRVGLFDISLRILKGRWHRFIIHTYRYQHIHVFTYIHIRLMVHLAGECGGLFRMPLFTFSRGSDTYNIFSIYIYISIYIYLRMYYAGKRVRVSDVSLRILQSRWFTHNTYMNIYIHIHRYIQHVYDIYTRLCIYVRICIHMC